MILSHEFGLTRYVLCAGLPHETGIRATCGVTPGTPPRGRGRRAAVAEVRPWSDHHLPCGRQGFLKSRRCLGLKDLPHGGR